MLMLTALTIIRISSQMILQLQSMLIEMAIPMRGMTATLKLTQQHN